MSRASRIPLLLLMIATTPGLVLAQSITLPRVSPAAEVAQTIGLTEVRISYHRPAVREREIWGGLVPYGQVWRAGANDNTTISFSTDVKIEGKPLAAGTYGLHMIPSEGDWIIAFSHNSTSWGSFTYSEDEDALRVTVTPKRGLELHERLSYEFDNLDPIGATASLRWERLRVPFEIVVDTHAEVLTQAQRELRHLPRFSWQGWYQLANYCFDNDIELEQALAWDDRSISIQPTFQNRHLRSQLLDRLGRAEDASQELERAMSVAGEAGINQLGYQFLMTGRTEQALELFRKNVADYPDSWNVHDSLGEGLAAAGDTAAAIKSYEKALSIAPEDQKQRIQGVLAGLRADG